MSAFTDIEEELDTVTAERDRLRDALEWYADSNSYCEADTDTHCGRVGIAHLAIVALDATKPEPAIIHLEGECWQRDTGSRVEQESIFVEIYNAGYASGHHETVEASYLDIHYLDRRKIHIEDVRELIEDIAEYSPPFRVPCGIVPDGSPEYLDEISQMTVNLRGNDAWVRIGEGEPDNNGWIRVEDELPNFEIESELIACVSTLTKKVFCGVIDGVGRVIYETEINDEGYHPEQYWIEIAACSHWQPIRVPTAPKEE